MGVWVGYVIGELLECILKYLALHLRSNILFTTNTSLPFLEQSLVGEILDRMVKCFDSHKIFTHCVYFYFACTNEETYMRNSFFCMLCTLKTSFTSAASFELLAIRTEVLYTLRCDVYDQTASIPDNIMFSR